MGADSLTNKWNTHAEGFNSRWECGDTSSRTLRRLLQFEDDCLQQMHRDEKNVAAPVSAAVQGVTTPRPPRPANTAVVQVLEYFLQLQLSSYFIGKIYCFLNEIHDSNNKKNKTKHLKYKVLSIKELHGATLWPSESSSETPST